MARQGRSGISRRALLKAAGTARAVIAFERKAPALASVRRLAQAAGADRVVPTLCAMCGPGLGCGISAHVQNGRFTRVEGMKECPLNQNRLCAKAHAAPQWVYSPQRLKYPMRRVGGKGEGKFQRIFWSQALELIASGFQEQKTKYGPESLAILSPARRTYSEYLYRFPIAHGSPNYGHSGICAMQKAFSLTYTLGTAPQPDIPRSKLILVWGKQPVYSGSIRGNLKALLDARERGARIIAIKPSMEPDVALADLRIPIRPGTDAALALAMPYVIVGENLYDRAFVEQWTFGFDKLAEHIRKYSPEWAEPITGLPARQIGELARTYATTRPARIDHGNGLGHAPSSNQAVRAIAILMAITGNLDTRLTRPGRSMTGPFFGRTPAPLGAPGRIVDRRPACRLPCHHTCATRVRSSRVRGTAMKNEDIPALIRELRQRLDVTQEQFAQKVGVTYSTVNHWENGKRVPLPFLVKRLVEMKAELDAEDAKPPRKKSRK